MRRYRLNVDPGPWQELTIEGDLFHHIFDVCRLEVGSHFELLDSKGNAHFVEVKAVGKRNAVVELKSTRQLPPLPKPYLVLAMAVPRFPVLESVLEKAVELGVHEVQLFFSEYSFVRGGDKISESRYDRWQKIIVSSTQQSGRGDLMRLLPPVKIPELFSRFNPSQGDWGLMAYEGETPRTVSEVVQAMPLPEKLGRIWCFVGAEGGFSPAEVKTFSDHGLQAASLGDQVLRVETACITMASILKYAVGHFGKTK